MLRKERNEDIFLNREYDKALNVIQQNPDGFGVGKGFIYLQKGDYKIAFDEFDKEGLTYQKGFCALLMGDYDLAKEIWYSSEESPAISWGKVLLGLLKSRLDGIPSFLQVRNYMESTLYYFFEAGQVEYAEKLISAKEFLADCNIEAYKYIGRTLMEYSEYKDLAQEYLKEATCVLPQDYEAFYLLGCLFIEDGEMDKAKDSLEQALRINEYHLPTRHILEANFN